MARKELDHKTKKKGIQFASRLKRERLKERLSQSELSALSNVPLDTLRSIENGRVASPGLFIAADLVYALNGRLDDWLPRKNKGKR